MESLPNNLPAYEYDSFYFRGPIAMLYATLCKEEGKHLTLPKSALHHICQTVEPHAFDKSPLFVASNCHLLTQAEDRTFI